MSWRDWPTYSAACRARESYVPGVFLVRLRPVERQDEEGVLAVRNELDTVFWSKTGQPVSDGAHARWFVNILAQRLPFLVVVEEARVMGYGHVSAEAKVAVAVTPAARGRGYAAALLAGLAQSVNVPELYAEVHLANWPSVNLFKSVGYTRKSCDGEWLTLVKSLR